MISDTIAIVIGLSIVALVCAKMVLGSTRYESILFKKRHLLTNQYVKELENALADTEKELTSIKRSIARQQGAPQGLAALLTGGGDALGPGLQAMMPTIAHKLPAWAQPIINDPQVVQAIIQWVTKNPDRLKAMLPHLQKAQDGNSTAVDSI